MRHRYEKPNKLLTEFVRTVLVMEGSSDFGSSHLPIFTNGMPTLYCRTEKSNDQNERDTQLSLFAQTPTDIWTVDKQSTIVAYFFKPFALAGLFNIHAKQLSEKPFDLSFWDPHKYTALRTQLIYSTGTSRTMAILDHLLIQQLNENQEVCKIIQYATDQMMCNSSKDILREIIRELRLNERTFQRLFKKHVGITPTQYRRICQFQQSFGQLNGKQFDKISEVAYDNGFADQSHFIRSFKEFTDITPKIYLKKGLKNKNP